MFSRVRASSLPLGFFVWIEDYLYNRTQSVRYRNIFSNTTVMTSGVPQGSILGPILFSVFMSDLTGDNLGLPECSIVVKYADDTVSVSSISQNLDCSLHCYESVSNWCKSNTLLLNTLKSHELIIPKATFDVNLIPITVNRVTEIKYFGVILNDKFNWSPHINHICKITVKRLYPLRILRPILPKHLLINIYFLLVRSIFDYASPVFFCMLNQSDISQLNRIQKRFHRIICCADSNCCVLPPLCDRRNSLAVSLFGTIIANPDHILYNLVLHRLPSGRFSFPYCRTNRRLNSFFPYVLKLL